MLLKNITNFLGGDDCVEVADQLQSCMGMGWPAAVTDGDNETFIQCITICQEVDNRCACNDYSRFYALVHHLSTGIVIHELAVTASKPIYLLYLF